MSPSMSDDRALLAGEYVLGTLSAPERADFERALAADPALRSEVRAWEARLGPLDEAAPAAPPSPEVWAGIERALGPASAGTVVRLPEHTALDRLRRSRGAWRAVAVASTALAAGLAVFIATGLPTGTPTDRYVAVVNRGGDLPALIVDMDPAKGTVRVRALAAEAPAGRSLELWYIGEGQAPKSLGVIDAGAQRMPMPEAAGGLAKATLAVSVEPPGGSPTGAPTGPVVYSGRLIKEQP